MDTIVIVLVGKFLTSLEFIKIKLIENFLFSFVLFSYVSCSECSYDSDNCTCNSADRCYCSLGAGDINAKLNKAEEERRSPSCNSDDKCYCSMGETIEGGSTTWCDDSDSCASASKCYCSLHDRKSRKKKSSNSNIVGLNSGSSSNINKSTGSAINTNNNNNKSITVEGGTRKNKSNRSRTADKLALDYELFTANGSGRHVKPTEALSVKKSVEMAAVFADVKLSQTTDITSLQPSKDIKTHKSKHHHKKHHNSNNNTIEENKKVANSNNNNNSKNDDYYLKANGSNEVILRKDLDISIKRAALKSDGYYQPIGQRPVSASLEDSLGYLP